MKTKHCVTLLVFLSGVVISQAQIDRTRALVNATTFAGMRESIQKQENPVLLKKEALTLVTRVEKAEDKNVALEAERKRLEGKVAELQATLVEKENQIAAKQREVEAKEKAVVDLDQRKLILDQQKSELDAAIARAGVDKARLITENTNLGALNEKLKNEVEVAQNLAKGLERQIGELKTERRDLEEEVVSAKQKARKAEEDVVETGDKLMKSIFGIIGLILTNASTAVGLIITIRSARHEDRRKEIELKELLARIEKASGTGGTKA